MSELERNLGEQPIAQLLRDRELTAHELVESSTRQLTFKMVTRACKGRRLTPNAKAKVLEALNAAAQAEFAMDDLFNY